MSIFFEEYDLDLYKLDNVFECEIDLYELEYLSENVVLDGFSLLKKILSKMIKIFLAYTKDIKEITTNYTTKIELKKNLKIIKKAVKTCPNLLKEKITFRLYVDFEKADNYYNTIVTNMSEHLRAISDVQLTNVIEGYDKYKADFFDKFVTINVSDAIDYVEKSIIELDGFINCQVKSLFDIKNILEEANNLEFNCATFFKCFIKKCRNELLRCSYILTLNVDDCIKGISKLVKKEVNEEVKKYKYEVSTKKMIKKSKFIKTIDAFGITFNIYETNYNQVSCCNIGGNDIYVNKNFFNQPKGMQNAILFHEFGHYINGDFNNRTLIKEKNIIKGIQKDIKKFNKIVNKSSYYDMKQLNDDTELIYLILELRADRFASKYVGKSLVSKSLIKRFDKELESWDVSDELKKYNKFRMNLRTKMI